MTAQSDVKIIVALDFPSIDAVWRLVDVLSPTQCRLKIGNILFTRYGPNLIEMLHKKGFEIFLDLKFHDIPQTVVGAVRSAAALGVWMVNVHANGGVRMMTDAAESLQTYQNPPKLVAVTVLTSLDKHDMQCMGITADLNTTVVNRAQLAQQCGLDGVVCSSQEVSLLRKKLASCFLLVTPGIRLPGDQADDQKRILSPEAAIKAGSDYLVIGRSITHSSDPVARLEAIYSVLIQ